MPDRPRAVLQSVDDPISTDHVTVLGTVGTVLTPYLSVHHPLAALSRFRGH